MPPTRNFKFKKNFILTAHRIETLILCAKSRTWRNSTLISLTQPPFMKLQVHLHSLGQLQLTQNIFLLQQFCTSH